MVWPFKSQDRKWAEAKQRAHRGRAANGQRVTRGSKNYTVNQQITDQHRILKTKRR